MKKSKAEILQQKIEKKEEALHQASEKVKELRTEIAKLKKEKEDAEMAELQSFMREYDITPRKAKIIIEQLQVEIKKEASTDEERIGTDSADVDSI